MKAFLRYSESNSGKNRWAILLRKPSLSSFGSRPSTRSRRFALQSTIARALTDFRGLAIGMAAAFFILFLMRGTL